VSDRHMWVCSRVLAAAAGATLVLVIAGCGESTMSSPETTTSTTSTTAVPPPTLDTVSYKNEARDAAAHGGLPWFCKAQGLGGAMDHGHPGGLANNAYEGKQKGDLSADDCTKLADIFDTMIQQVKPYRTRGDLKKTGGFSQSVQFVPGLGTHDVVRDSNGGFSTRMGVPPGPPMFLQYDGDGDDAPLAGMSWLSISPNGPPPGFPGDNDWWHTHSKLCYSGPGTVIGNEISDDQCKSMGGENRSLPGVWMSHAWIVPGFEDRYDVFSGAYMCVKGTGKPPAADDPCHDDRSDPEHGNAPMPGMDHSSPTTSP
jgi:hypothetical protein